MKEYKRYREDMKSSAGIMICMTIHLISMINHLINIIKNKWKKDKETKKTGKKDKLLNIAQNYLLIWVVAGTGLMIFWRSRWK